MSEDTTKSLVEARLDQILSLVKELQSEQKATTARLESLEKNLESLNTKVDQRLHDTRPIWEAVQAQLDEVVLRLGNVEGDLRELRAETMSGFRTMDRRIGVLSKNMVELTADIRELQDRVEKLETQPS